MRSYQVTPVPFAQIPSPRTQGETRAESDPVMMPKLRLSVVIPTLDEAGAVAGAIRSALAAGATEVIVADGGSRDGTTAIAAVQGASVVRAPRGWGPQLNAGAAAARGDALCFLHADGRLAPAAGASIRKILNDPSIIGGNFRPHFGRSAHGRFLAALYHVIRRLRIYYGDSAIFCRTDAFWAVGGFPAYPLMEDLAFVHRLHRRGRMAYLQVPVFASPRRWQQGGIAQVWASWLVIQSLYFLRISPQRLALLYRQIR